VIEFGEIRVAADAAERRKCLSFEHVMTEPVLNRKNMK
jgi:hypothetical protein